MAIRFAHPHIRIRDIAESLDFYCGKLGLVETSRKVVDGYTLLYLTTPDDLADAHVQWSAPKQHLIRTSWAGWPAHLQREKCPVKDFSTAGANFALVASRLCTPEPDPTYEEGVSEVR